MLARFLVAAIFLTLSVAGHAATPVESAEAFFAQVGKGETDKAIDALFAGSGVAEMKPQAIAAMKAQTKAAMGIYGKPIGIEKLFEENFSPSLKRLVYLQKFDHYAVAWEIYFYRAKDKWTVYQINFNDQISLIVGARK